jgi:bacterioferritin
MKRDFAFQENFLMKGDTKVIEYLNDALRHELTAVNQYWLHYRLFDNWGVNELAAKWREEAIEEMRHADRLIDRIIFLEGFPNMQTLDALHIGKTPKDVIENDLQLEIVARNLYTEAAHHCHAAQDFATRDLFESLIQDEEHHIDLLETQLDLIGRIGVELYTQHHIGKPEKN